MTFVLYIQAYLDSVKAYEILMRLYEQVNSGNIEGLISISPVLTSRQLTALTEKVQNHRFAKESHLFEYLGMGVWSEWKSGKALDDFYKSNYYIEFQTSVEKFFKKYKEGLVNCVELKKRDVRTFSYGT